MGQKHETYSDYYDPRDRIPNLNFYTNFQRRYNEMSDEATTIGGRIIKQSVDEFVWDEDMIDYVKELGHILEVWIGLMQKEF